jgi:hypothetical protein
MMKFESEANIFSMKCTNIIKQALEELSKCEM